MSDRLELLLDQLKTAREDNKRLSETTSAIRKHYQELLDADPNYAESMDQLKNRQSIEEGLSEAIRAEVLGIFAASGNKKPSDRAEVKIFKTVVRKADEQTAREWCFTNFRPALKMDAKIFDKAVKEGSIPADLAVVVDEPRVQIATKLD